MSPPERLHGEPQPEHEPRPWYQAARFAAPAEAGSVYAAAQDALAQTPDADISVYRFLLNDTAHVAALGQVPPAGLAETLNRLLVTGTPVQLPDEIVSYLARRRRQAIRFGPWVERHVRSADE